MNSLMPTYARKPVSFVKGHGAWLWDDKNEKYLDALSGIAVCGLGHAHPAIADTISQQANNLLHTSNLYRIPQQEALGDRLCEITGMQRVFFANSGAEANEAAIKLARLHGHARNIDSPATIVFENSFHGRTMATLTATGNAAAHKGYDPLLPGFVRAPYNDIAAVKALCSQHKNISAILVEPIQGEGGITAASYAWLQNIEKICKKHDILLIVDDIQAGCGRTGTFFSFDEVGIQPDIITMSKSLSGYGLPFAMVLFKPEHDIWKPGEHNGTFRGNNLAFVTAEAAIKHYWSDDLFSKEVKRKGKYMYDRINKIIDQYGEGNFSSRGRGMFQGINCVSGDLASKITKLAFKNGLMIETSGADDHVIKFLCPLTISDQNLKKGMDILEDAIETVCAKVKNFDEEVDFFHEDYEVEEE